MFLTFVRCTIIYFRTMYEKTVLIAGTGPTGLTLAIDLLRRGISCRLIEAAETPFSGSRGKGIQPRTLEIFDDLGIIEPILAAGGLYPRLRIHLGPLFNPRGFSRLLQAAHREHPLSKPVDGAAIAHRGNHARPFETLAAEVEFDTALVTFAGSVGLAATLSTGETVRVGLPGGVRRRPQHVRKTIGLKLEGEAIDEKPMLVADVEIDGLDSTTGIFGLSSKVA